MTIFFCCVTLFPYMIFFFLYFFESRHIGGCGLLAQIKSALSLWNGSFFFFLFNIRELFCLYFECFNENVIFVRLTGKEGQFSHLNLFFWQKKTKKKKREDQLTKSVMNCLLAVRLKENFNFKSFFFVCLFFVQWK